MGGKHKKAQRTKQNAKPSSSGRSAELLGASLLPCTTATSTTSIKPGLGFSLSGLSVPKEEDICSDTNFQLIFKKMNKRDGTTKAKALQQFTELVQESSSDAVKAILTFWARLYNVLATDVDHHVREASQTAHYQVVSKVERNIAPYLKQFIPPWFISQFDTYAPAATAASKSFKAIFPSHKIPEVLLYCQNEILTYIHENIILQTLPNVSNSKNVVNEDIDARCERLLISSLQAFSSYLQTLSDKDIMKSCDWNSKIVENAKFWKLAKHKSVPVRAAFFANLSIMAQKPRFLIENEKNQVCAIVFVNLDEYEPSVTPYIWEAALIIMDSLKDWGNVINIEKSILPKLWKVLKEGGKGNARIIHPHILPLIDKLNSIIDMTSYWHKFFDSFSIGHSVCDQSVVNKDCESTIPVLAPTPVAFTATQKWVAEDQQIKVSKKPWKIGIRTPNKSHNEFFKGIQKWKNIPRVLFKIKGLKQKNVVASKIETAAIANSLIECIKYVIMKSYADTTFSSDVIQLYLLPLVSWCLTNDQSNHKVFFKQVASLILHWSQISKQKDYDNYQKYLSLFWNRAFHTFTEVFKSNLKDSKDTVSEICDRQVDLLQCFKEATLTEPQMKVKFSDDLVPVDKTQRNQKIDAEEYIRELEHLVVNVCDFYISLIDEKGQVNILKPLSMIVELFDNPNLFIDVSKCHMHTEDGKVMTLYQDVLYNWMNSEDLDYETVVILVFCLYKYLSSEERNIIVETFSSITKFEKILCCLRICLSKPLKNDPAMQLWLSSKQISYFLEECLNQLIEDNNIHSEIYIILEDVVRLTEDGGIYISADTVTNIIRKLVEHLKITTNFVSGIDACASLASHIAKVVYNRVDLFQYNEDLLLVLFHLMCYSNTHLDILGSDASSKVTEAWNSVTTVLSLHLTEDVLRQLIINLSEYVETEYLNYSTTHMFINNILVNLFREINENAEIDLKELLNIFFEKTFVNATRRHLSTIGIMAEYIKGNISLPNENIFKNQTLDFCDVNIDKFFAWNNLKMEILCTIIESNKPDENNVDKKNHDDSVNLQFYESKNMPDFLIYVLYDFALAVILSESYQSTKFYKNVYKNIKNLQQHIFSVLNIDQFDKQIFNMVMMKLEDDNSWVWYKLLTLLYSEILPHRSSQMYNIISQQLIQNSNKIGQFFLAKLFKKQVSRTLWESNNTTVESIIILRNSIHSDCDEVHINGIMAQISAMGHTHFNWNMASWTDMQIIIEASRFFSNLLKDKDNIIKQKYWDVIVIFLASWTENLVKLKTSYRQIEVEALVTSVVDLFISVENYISDLKADNPNHNFVNEWRDLFAQSAHDNIFQLWIYFSDKIKADEIETHLYLQPFLEEYGVVITKCNYKNIFRGDTLPKWSKFRDRCFQLLRSRNTLLQLWGYKMLLVLIPGLINIDSQAVHTHTPHKDGLTLKQFEELLVSIQDILNIMLNDIRLGENSCQVQEFTDSFTYTLAYLLLWDVLLMLCKTSSTELNYQYADWLKETSLLHHGLNIFFRLMPAEVLHYTDNKQNQFVDMFTKQPIMTLKGPCPSKVLEHLVCWVYTFALSQLPALVRQWWSSLEIRVAQVVERVTVAYVSPYICTQELSAVMKHETTFKNMTVRVVPGAREVLAVYTVDEAQMELVIALPANYPLGSPDVQCNKQIGGTSHKQWLMQLKKCLLHQNGSIWDGLALWNKNLNRKFDGVEECYICFGVLHPGTYQLPKLSCQTCKKKFHSACLYKWFSTSNKSSCPICRNLF